MLYRYMRAKKQMKKWIIESVKAALKGQYKNNTNKKLGGPVLGMKFQGWK